MPVSLPPQARTKTARARTLSRLLLLPILLSGCGNGAFVDRRREAGQPTLTYVGESTPNAPSICYNRLLATPADVIALARTVCAKTGTVPVLRGQTSLDCRIFYPARANFQCVAPGEAFAAFQP
ncbi:MAG: hypothetical protein JXQ84_10420 [Rhodospirillaceae bacterium]|nr:hypothetical protein [Rhodospirillaceae bacterium]